MQARPHATPPGLALPLAAAGQPRQGAHQWLRAGAWLAYALFWLTAPWVFASSHALTMLNQMAYLVIICLSYNVLLGQGGMLSFGHAVYVGAGAYATVYALNAMPALGMFMPVSLLPLFGGMAAVLAALLPGYVNTRRGGTAFAMISLGIAELVIAVALMFPFIFGGEGGLTTDRVVGKPWLGISFGPDIQVYYLAAAWALACTGLLYLFTFTPLGQMLQAVRDNPQRVAFVGYSPEGVRYRAFLVSAFFAGVGGALMALQLEVVSPAESFSHERSGAYLLFTFVGGIASFAGPILGAALMVLTTVGLSAYTQAWKLYLGLLFVLMVMFAPHGLAGIVRWHWQSWRPGAAQRMRVRVAMRYLAVLLAGLSLLGSSAVLIEMLYHTQLHGILGAQLQFAGLQLDIGNAKHWLCALAAAGATLLLFWLTLQHLRQALHEEPERLDIAAMPNASDSPDAHEDRAKEAG